MSSSLMLVWDCLFSNEAIVDNAKTVKAVAAAMDEACESLVVDAVARWNTVLGGAVSRAGFTSGLRLVISIDRKSTQEVKTIHTDLQKFSHELVDISTIRLAENLETPLRLNVKNRFPLQGRIAISTTFTNGLGYTELKQIQNAKKNQTVDTKNGLDIKRMDGKGSGKRFSNEFHAMIDNSDWFTVSNIYGTSVTEELTGADGGMYESTFDISRCIEELVSISGGVWWNALNPEDLTLNPILSVDYSNPIDSEYDPAMWLHLSKANFKKALEAEERQTGSETEIEDIQYLADRITRGSRSVKQLTSQHGLVAGLEKGLISKHVIQPWIALEFINCLKYYLMTRMPNFWRNNKSEIWLFHEFNEISLSELLED